MKPNQIECLIFCFGERGKLAYIAKKSSYRGWYSKVLVKVMHFHSWLVFNAHKPVAFSLSALYRNL